MLFEAKRASRDYSGGLWCQRLGLDACLGLEGFLSVSRVTSLFRAATTEGNRFTHSGDRSPEGSRISWAYWCPKRRSARVRLKRSVETLSSFSRPFCLRGLQLFDCLVVTLALFVEVRASQHREQVVRPRDRQGVHYGATNEHCYARHYFRISAGISPCVISMSLVAMAIATSTTTMPTSQGVKSSFGGGLPSIAILQSRAYPAARPETTALWYSALRSILPSVAGVVMVLFHTVGVEASLQLGRFILDYARGACRHRRGTGAQAHVFARKDIRKYTPARQAPLIHGIQLGSGRSSVRFASFGEADVPSLSAAPTGGRNDSLAV